MKTNKIKIKNLTPLIIASFFVSVNLIWFKIDQAPPMWDQSFYLQNSEVLYHALVNKGIIAFIKAFMSILQMKAPLITILPIPLYIIFGNNYTSALLINCVFIFVGSYYLYRLGSIIAREQEALLSIFILNTFPLIIGISREFLVEFGLMVFVIMWMYYLFKSEYFNNKRYVYILGMLLGLGMLMKISFILYILFPTFFIFLKSVVDIRNITKKQVQNIFIILFLGILVAGPWYIKNLNSIFNFALSSGYGETAKNYGLGGVFSLNTIFSYWIYLINYGISVYFFSMLFLLIVINLLFFRKTNITANIDKTHFYFLLLWFIVPFIVFTFGVNKDYRYTAPFYPPLALLMSIALMRLKAIKYWKIIFPALLIFPLFNYFYLSFSTKSTSVHIGQFILLNNWLVYAHPPVKEQWPQEK